MLECWLVVVAVREIRAAVALYGRVGWANGVLPQSRAGAQPRWAAIEEAAEQAQRARSKGVEQGRLVPWK